MAGKVQNFLDGGGPYALQMFSLTDDIVGHAWMGVRRGDGKTGTMGFWPTSLAGAIAWPGALLSADPHTGGQTNSYEEAVSKEQIYKILDVVQDYDGGLYSLIFHNCTHFVVAIWMAAAGKVFPGTNEDLMVDWWTPLMLGMAIDERNKQQKDFAAAGATGQSKKSGP